MQVGCVGGKTEIGRNFIKETMKKVSKKDSGKLSKQLGP